MFLINFRATRTTLLKGLIVTVFALGSVHAHAADTHKTAHSKSKSKSKVTAERVQSSTKAAPTAAALPPAESIAVVVNQTAITTSDIRDRMRLIATSTGMPQTPEVAAKLGPQVTEVLIAEALKLQEAKRLGIKIDDKEVDGGFYGIAQQNNLTPDNFKKMLTASGVSPTTLMDQIRSQIAWGKIIQQRVRPKIEVMDSDIDNELQKLKRNIGQPQYHLAQIFLPLPAPQKAAAAQEFLSKLIEELRKKPDAFGKAAQQFSQSPDATNGGDIGFVSPDQMPAEVAAILPQLKEGEVADVIKTKTGYYILMLRGTRTVSEKDLPTREEILQRLGNQRLDRGARRYFQDLMSAAFIESRL